MSEEPLIVEDTLLLLFQPDSGIIAGENILFYVLGGAVLADLALAGRVEAEEQGLFTRVRAAGDGDAPDPLLAPALTSLSKKPQDVQAVLAGIGPQLRGPVLDRVVARGDLHRAEGKVLGLFPTTKLTLASERRSDLIRSVRAALIDGDAPDPRTAASIALLSASGTLPQFHAEIPWGSDVYTRAKQLEDGDWGAAAASSAVVRTMNAVIMNTVIAATVLPRL
ncbi:GPP34 family phosphoprotein [Microbacterium foliorum]|uniref:GPP34 family phosphoprotein n=1 Tax=Microbacterium foliorum TaxID=104336 RepID=A0A4Y5YTR8_9MICO|nr:GPP34 family phosphoprotein [Microbacterium foliorum]QDE35948.1 GPP34 family phosphoprotein [Microbacterium foliorum]